MERADCRSDNSPELGSRLGAPAEHQLREWLTSAGPRAPETPPPSFLCLRILATYLSDAQGSEWCGPQGTARVSWTIAAGTPPYLVAVGGLTVPGELGYVDIFCETVRDLETRRDAPEQLVVDVPVSVRDSNGRTAQSSLALNLVSAPPERAIGEIKIVPGVSDALVVPFPPVEFADGTAEAPFGKSAVVRYRAQGDAAWRYATPVPPRPQSGCGYHCSASAIGELEPDTPYELQAAWMWNFAYSDPARSTDDFKRLGPEDQTAGDGWWRAWVAPERLQWSKIHRFRTHGPFQLRADATHDTVRVSWPAPTGRFHARAYSPQWPGVVWADRDNSYQRRRRVEGSENGVMSSVIGGLPADTPFVIVVRQVPPPRSFSQEAGIAVQTEPDPGRGPQRSADPSDIEVKLVGRTLIVEWTKQWPTAYTSVTLFQGTDARGSAVSGRRIPPPPPSAHKPLDQQLSRRVRVEFADRPPGSAWTLYLNRTPGHMSGPEHPIPYLCMIWSIEVPRSRPHAHLDRYFYSPQVTVPAAVRPGEIRSEEQLWKGCALGEPIHE